MGTTLFPWVGKPRLIGVGKPRFPWVGTTVFPTLGIEALPSRYAPRSRPGFRYRLRLRHLPSGGWGTYRYGDPSPGRNSHLPA